MQAALSVCTCHTCSVSPLPPSGSSAPVLLWATAATAAAPCSPGCCCCKLGSGRPCPGASLLPLAVRRRCRRWRSPRVGPSADTSSDAVRRPQEAGRGELRVEDGSRTPSSIAGAASQPGCCTAAPAAAPRAAAGSPSVSLSLLLVLAPLELAPAWLSGVLQLSGLPTQEPPLAPAAKSAGAGEVGTSEPLLWSGSKLLLLRLVVVVCGAWPS